MGESFGVWLIICSKVGLGIEVFAAGLRLMPSARIYEPCDRDLNCRVLENVLRTGFEIWL